VPTSPVRNQPSIEQLRGHRLDRSLPLWQMCFLTGLPERRIGLFIKMHPDIDVFTAGVRDELRALAASTRAEPS